MSWRNGWHHHPVASFLIETYTKIKVRNHQRVSSHHMIDMCIFSEAYLPKKEPPVMAMWLVTPWPLWSRPAGGIER